MLTNKTDRKRESQPPREQGEAEPSAKRPRLDPGGDKPVAVGRPHQAFVESRLKQYLRDENVSSLVKPTQEEIRAAALRILVQALRRRKHRWIYLDPVLPLRAVADMAQYVREQRWTTRPLSLPTISSDYLQALVQLAEDTGWLGRELSLPAHLDPQHPPIYYYMETSRADRPVPRDDALLRGDYVHFTVTGGWLIEKGHFYPWRAAARPTPNDLFTRGWLACYTLYFGDENEPEIMFHYLDRIAHFYSVVKYPLRLMRFSPPRSSMPDAGSM